MKIKLYYLLLILIAFSSCTKEYITNETDGSSIAPAVEVKYFDQFQRADMQGVLGMPQVGNPYALLGGGIINGVQPTCQIKDGRWCTPDMKDVYATQAFTQGTKINYASVTLRWDNNKATLGDGVFIIIFGDNTGLDIAKNMIHIRVMRSGIPIDVFENGRSRNVNYIPFDVEDWLQAGRDYTYTFWVQGNAIYYSLTGTKYVGYVADPSYAGKVGKAVTFEHFYNSHHDENTISVREQGAGVTL